MTMKRICPFCKSNMHSNSVYFCISCGNVLPESLQLKDISFKNTQKMEVDKKRNTGKGTKVLFSKTLKSIPSSYVLIGGLCLLLMAVGFYFLVKYSNLSIYKMSAISDVIDVKESSSSGINIPQIINIEKPKNIVDMDLNVISGIFGLKDIYTFIPYEADFYIEVSDIGTLDSYFSFMGGEFFTLTEALRGKVSSSYYAFFMEKGLSRGWTFIVFPLEDNTNVGTYKDVTIGRVGGALVISKQEVLINEVSTARSGITKNLSQNPSFIKIKNDIPVEGKIFMMSLTDGGKSVLSDLMRDSSSTEFKSVITSFENSKSNYFIVK